MSSFASVSCVKVLAGHTHCSKKLTTDGSGNVEGAIMCSFKQGV